MSSEDKNNGGNTLSKNELEVYDRQIRLWGYDGQKKYLFIIKWLE